MRGKHFRSGILYVLELAGQGFVRVWRKSFDGVTER
jgi:hypothetical protein